MSLLEIIFSDSLLNAVTFYRNMYTNFLASETSRYNINLTFFINQFTIIRIKLYKTLVSNSFKEDSLIIKFITTNVYN